MRGSSGGERGGGEKRQGRSSSGPVAEGSERVGRGRGGGGWGERKIAGMKVKWQGGEGRSAEKGMWCRRTVLPLMANGMLVYELTRRVSRAITDTPCTIASHFLPNGVVQQETEHTLCVSRPLPI